MALETPNRMVASGVLLIDTLTDVGPHQSFRSSNGIKRKVSEVDTSFVLGTGQLGTYEFEQAVTNDEAIVFTSLLGLGVAAVATELIGYVAPLIYQTGAPEVDDVPANLLVLLSVVMTADPPGRTRARHSVAVWGLPTAVEPIAGEPLPPPPP